MCILFLSSHCSCSVCSDVPKAKEKIMCVCYDVPKAREKKSCGFFIVLSPMCSTLSRVFDATNNF
jgi:hypothetical protein